MVACMTAGCGAHEHVHDDVMGTRVEAPELVGNEASAAAPAPGRARTLLLGPITCTARPIPTKEGLETIEDGNTRADLVVLRASLRDALLATGRFDGVHLIEESASLDAATRDVAVRIDTALGEARVRSLETDGGAFAVSALLWSCTGFFSSWRHDKGYELAIDPVFTLTAPGAASPTAVVATGPTRVADVLSFFERRSGSGPFVAAFFGAPPLAFDAMPFDVTTSLGARAWAEPATRLAAELSRLRRRVRLTEARVVPGAPVSARLLAPAPGSICEGTDVEVQVRISVRPESKKRLREVRIGERRMTASGVRFDVPVRVSVVVGVLPVEVVLDNDLPSRVLEIRLDAEWSKESTGYRLR